METKTCQNCKKDFTIESDDFSFYKQIEVPAPTFCPLCRAQRRMAWHNENTLFKRKSDFSGKEIFSGFNPSASVRVYEKIFGFLMNGIRWIIAKIMTFQNHSLNSFVNYFIEFH